MLKSSDVEHRRDARKRVLQLDPSWDLFFDSEAPVTLVMPDGRSVTVQYDLDRHALHGIGMSGLTATHVLRSAQDSARLAFDP